MISCVLGAGFTLASVLKNESVFQQFLIKNLSLSDSIANLLLNTPVSLGEVFTITNRKSSVCLLY